MLQSGERTIMVSREREMAHGVCRRARQWWRTFGVLCLMVAAPLDSPAQHGITFTTLHTFKGTDGKSPNAALIQATDGNLYGTTTGGGALGNFGTVFKITPLGAIT